MASMQVINNAFNNLNGAFSTIMQHNRQQRAMDIEEQYQKDLLAYRQAIAAQDQANKDREYQRLVEFAKQAQENWNTTRQDKLNDQAYARELAAKQEAEKKAIAERQHKEQQEQKTQNEFREMFAIAKDYGADMAETYARGKAGDPIAKNLFMQGIEKHKKNQEAQQLYSRYSNYLNRIKEKQEEQAIAEQKNQNYLLNNILKLEDPVKKYEDYLKIKSMMNNANQGNIHFRPPEMTPEQKKKYKDNASRIF